MTHVRDLHAEASSCACALEETFYHLSHSEELLLSADDLQDSREWCVRLLRAIRTYELLLAEHEREHGDKG